MRALSRVVLTPATAVLNRMTVAWKLSLIGVVLIAPAVYVAVQYRGQQQDQIAFSAKEQVGAEYIASADALLRDLVLLRSAAVKTSAGLPADLDAARARVLKTVGTMNDVDERLGGELETTEAWTKLERSISGLADAGGGSPQAVYDAHTEVNAAALGLITLAGDTSNLILDPDLDTYYLMDAVVVKLPTIVETAGQAADQQVVMTAGGATPTMRQRIDLAAAGGVLESTMTAVLGGLGTAYENTADDALQPALTPLAKGLTTAAKAQTTEIDRAIGADVDPRAAEALGAASVTRAGALAAEVAPQMDRLIGVRIDGFRSAERKTLLIAGLGVAIGVYLFLALFVAITTAVRRMVEVAEHMAEGDADHHVDVRSRDEFGRLGGAFDRMGAYLRDSAGVADRIAEGDLTVEPEPHSDRDVLGSALLAMVQRLRDLVSRVSGSATTLTSASQEMATTSEQASRAVDEIATAMEQVAVGARDQQLSVRSTREATESIAQASRDSAEQAHATRDAAEQARAAADEGLQAANDATEAMRTVREASADASEAIAALGERAREIGGIVDTINGIAEQTNLLALNAAIEAARAGEHGRGFAVVAAEVRPLAEESQRATASIASLIGEMQAQTDAAVTAVDAGAERSEQGDATVERTREAFTAIEQAIRRVAERVEEISGAIGSVVSGSEHVLSDVASVAEVADRSSETTEHVSASTQQTSASTQEIASAAKALQQTAGELERAVAAFRV
ncbi:MAG: methyl-accepting chemotaxis protein [Baekduiaceae bacterium]